MRYARVVRAIWAATVVLAACNPPAAAPAPVASSASSAPSVPPLTLGGWSPALLARLARDADAKPPGQLDAHPPPDAERDRAIRAAYGERCRLERTCGPLWGVDCEAAVDGPYHYLRPRTDHVEELATCGGACMGGRCTDCPPVKQGWTCATY